MIPEYSNILVLAGKKQAEYKKILKQLKNLKQLDLLFQDAHEKVFSYIDCKKCANCCAVLGPKITQRDIGVLAKVWGMKEAGFSKEYLRTDADGDQIFKTMPCPFLEPGLLCGVYPERPKACREFPHTDEKNMKIKLDLAEKNLTVCPAVSLILDKLASNLKKPAEDY